MRRSAAPSQVLGNAGKKPRFIPPGKCIAVCPKSETKEMDQEIKLKEIDEKEGSASLLSKINVQNQNENYTQSVESTEKVKTKSCFSTDKCSKAEMKMLNVLKAAHLLFGWFLVQENLVFHPSLTSANPSSKRNFPRSHGQILSLS